MSEDRFDWNNDPSIVLRPRYTTAIYINSAGDICVRQEQWPEDDVCIVIPIEDGEYFGSCVAAIARAGAKGECAFVRGTPSKHGDQKPAGDLFQNGGPQ